MNFIFYLHCGISPIDGGGTVQLHLAKCISERGFTAKVICPDGGTKNSIYNNFGSINDVNDDTIAVYCEAIAGNPLGAKRVVRWILYGAWHSNIQTFADNEMIYYHLPFCKLNKPSNFLSCHYVNPNSFNKGLYRYRESCYIMKKGRHYAKNCNGTRTFGQLKKPNLIRSLRSFSTNNSYEIDYLKSQEEFIEVFNTTKYFFCYDPVCFLVVIALMCGCIVIQDPMAGYTELEYLYATLRSPERIKGLAYGIDNLPYANATIHEAPEQCRKLVEANNSSIDTFIQQIKNNTYSTNKCYDFHNSPYSFQHGYFKNKIMNNSV